MTFSNINVSTANDGLGDKLRDAFVIVNENFSLIGDIVTPEYISATLSNYTTVDYVTNELADIDSVLLGIISRLDADELDISTLQTELESLSLLVQGKASLTQLNSSIANVNNTISAQQNEIDDKIEDAPKDGFIYGRKDGSWIKLS